MTICEHCHLPDATHICVEAQSRAMRTLLGLIGDKAACSGCGVEIYWVRHRNGKKAPYTPSGMNHFLDCRKALEFRR